MDEITHDAVDSFIDKWNGVVASELSTSQSFLIDLCRLLGVDAPHPTPEQDYMFERPITFAHGDGSTSAGRIDLYRRGAFVLESKKLKAATHTRGFDEALLRARTQAEQYARALPAEEGRPPFVVVVDVGNRIELYAEFSRSGGTYTPFPDPRSHRIALADLRDDKLRDRLRQVWTDPLALDPSRESARVTRAIAEQLAELAKSLEAAGHGAEAVAQFLMRCLFTMFAEDVRLLPQDSFRDLLQKFAEQPDIAMRMLGELWRDMDRGGFSPAIASEVLRFNGKLFKHPDTLPLDKDQLALLIKAAKADWRHVEPAIFGTLLERALNPKDRHKLGAHYTPRAYVERLVLPTVIEPLRAEWNDAYGAAMVLDADDHHDEAVDTLRRFHHRLCTVRVLDPACGSGNFLYVTLEHLKRLEGEVLNALDELGDRQTGLALGSERADAAAGETVDPHNLLGIELNPRAAAIAEVVLWIGYLQWHFRTRGDVSPPIPVIRDFRNIECRDAVLAYDEPVEFVLDERGVPVTRWDGETMKPSPVTGEPIPDETARKPVERYVNPRKAAWPEADFVVGNPPFIGKSKIRQALGTGYVDALRSVWPEVPDSADFVMYWWYRAAVLASVGLIKRFGLISTNSISHGFNRRIVDFLISKNEPGISIVFAHPDHPWDESPDSAAVRVSMLVCQGGLHKGRLSFVSTNPSNALVDFVGASKEFYGIINADLSIGGSIYNSAPLISNKRISSNGVMLGSREFLIEESVSDDYEAGSIKKISNGNDILQKKRNVRVIDFYGKDKEFCREEYPVSYQHVLDRVKPVRDQNTRIIRRERWWLFSEVMPQLRAICSGIDRYIATPETSKHRIFVFMDSVVLAEHPLVAIGTDNPFVLGVLSSEIHITWSLAIGGTLENRPRYNKSLCFETFAFPGFESGSEKNVAFLAEKLDTHRKRQQAAHPELTLTGMYNVLEKLRSGEPLTAKERVIHEQGLVSVLRQLHDELDAAVLDAYGWSDLLPLLRVAHGNDAPAEGQTREDAKRAFDEAVLERLVALNAERAAEEARGLVRWLRPEFQNPQSAPRQAEIEAVDDVPETDDVPAIAVPAAKPQPWPKDAVAQVRAVADALSTSAAPLSIDDIAARFTARGPWKKRLPQLLEMLVAMGRAREADGRYQG